VSERPPGSHVGDTSFGARGGQEGGAHDETRRSRDDPHGREPGWLHRPKGRERRLARDLGRVRARDTLDPEYSRELLETIDCYVMGSRTYETALQFEAKGLVWSYGDKPVIVLTSRDLRKTR
jgi:hypothetical protein